MCHVETSSRPSHLPSERELLVALRAGDEDAYEYLVRSQAGRMLAVARRYLRNEEDAREAVQDAFLSAHRALPSFKGVSKLSTWLHRIVVNSALMKLRSQRRRPETSIEDLLPRFLADGHQARPAKSWGECGETALLRREVRDHVRFCIDQLPDSYRIVLRLRDVDELDTQATARLLGVSAQVVKTRLHRARQALRTLLDPYMCEEASKSGSPNRVPTDRTATRAAGRVQRGLRVPEPRDRKSEPEVQSAVKYARRMLG